MKIHFENKVKMTWEVQNRTTDNILLFEPAAPKVEIAWSAVLAGQTSSSTQFDHLCVLHLGHLWPLLQDNSNKLFIIVSFHCLCFYKFNRWNALYFLQPATPITKVRENPAKSSLNFRTDIFDDTHPIFPLFSFFLT